MNIINLLDLLEANSIHVKLDGDDLELVFEKEEDYSELIEVIKSHKKALVGYLQKYASNQDLESIERIPLAADYVVSEAQRSMWLLSQNTVSSLAYNLPNLIQLDQKIELSDFKQALAQVVERHEILRTVFKKNEVNEIRQIVLPIDQFKIEIHDLDLSKEKDAVSVLSSIRQKDNAIAFDLEQGPLWRAYLIRMTKDRFAFYYNMHHIISDGWSMGVLEREVMLCYEKISSKQNNQLAVLPIQYKDYSSWQQKQLQEGILEDRLTYWKDQLTGDLPIIDLPSSKLRPSIKTHRGQLLSTHISEEATEALKSFSLEQKGSLFMTLQAIFLVVLHKYTSKTDFIIGAPSSGRNHPALLNQIGCYINTLVFRNQLDAEDSFIDLYHKITRSTLAAFANEYPFNVLAQKLPFTHDSSRNILFDMMLVLQNVGPELKTPELSEMQLNAINVSATQFAKVDLECIFKEKGKLLSFEILYNQDIYDYELMEQFIVHFKILIDRILKNPQKSIAEFSLLSERDKSMLSQFNDTKVDYPFEKTILDAFREQVQKRPNQIAVQFECRKVNFQELDQRSDRLAAYLLHQFKISTGDLISLQLERSEWMLISIIAVLKCGGAYVPIDVDYPQERVDYILEDSKFKVLIDEAELERFKKVEDHYLRLESKNEIVANSSAYAIYTSGSTGIPKGVLNHHKGLLNRLLWMRDQLNINPSDTILQKTPYTFDVSVWELLMPLVSGCCVTFAKPNGHKDPLYLEKIILEYGITIIHFVPSMLDVFLSTITEPKLNKLRHLICSGEALAPSLISQFKKQFPEVCIHNYYGPTEAAVDVTSINLTPIDELVDGVSIGAPVANTQIYIVDEYLKLQAIGIQGELLIGGVQVAQGYLNKEKLNTKKFIDNPFLQGERLYRTGDLAKWKKNGTLEFLGRIDHQVKIRGNRIELGEIQKAVESFSKVSKCVVLVKEDNQYNKRLVTFVIPEIGFERTALFRFLNNKLPNYMVPSMALEVTEFPLSANGKLDRKALLKQISLESKKTTFEGTEVQKKVANVFEDILNINHLTLQDDFFHIGGDSIIAIRLVTKINTVFNTSISIENLYDYNTIKLLSDFIERISGNEEVEKKTEEEIDLFASLKQEVMGDLK